MVEPMAGLNPSEWKCSVVIGTSMVYPMITIIECSPSNASAHGCSVLMCSVAVGTFLIHGNDLDDLVYFCSSSLIGAEGSLFLIHQTTIVKLFCLLERIFYFTFLFICQINVLPIVQLILVFLALKEMTFHYRSIIVLSNAGMSPYCRYSIFWGMRLGRGIIHIMMQSALLNMDYKQAKGYLLIKPFFEA